LLYWPATRIWQCKSRKVVGSVGRVSGHTCRPCINY
jgi:hypothetical protein